MSYRAETVSDAVRRLSDRDASLTEINLSCQGAIDAEAEELADCLLAHPDVVKRVYLGDNQLTDETGVKLARYLAASSTVQFLDLSYGQFGTATYLALAAALRVNSSLQHLYLHSNETADESRVEAAFAEALRLNPDRPADSIWSLCSSSNDFQRLKTLACELGHPSLQLLLC